MDEFHARTAEEMAHVPNETCKKCGAKIFADTNFCAACLLETGLEPLGESDDPKPRPRRSDFGNYELLEEIGRGGQGIVYRARQKSLNRIVALKVIALGNWATEAHSRRFRLEAEAIASLDQPGIVPIYEVGEHDGHCYFTMKFIEGERLDRMVQKNPMPIRDAAQTVAALARTVHYAHERGVLHRDIKPGNVLVSASGQAHLTDFGLAKLVETESTITNTDDLLGTPSYMAPEQITGAKELTTATDVYGLGAVLFEMLTRRAPFLANAKYEVIRQVRETEPARPRTLNRKVDIDLETICLKCLEKEPAQRYPSALALAEDLERWLQNEPVQARRSGIVARGRKLVQRNPTTAALVCSLGMVALALGLAIWKAQPVTLPNGIAVLPFANLGEASESASLADGMQDDILTKLAKIADLKVISRTSVMSYRGALNIPQIGRTLNVSHLLEGSVRRDADKIHLNVQLIDTRTDMHVWAEQYDYKVDDVFAIQSRIAQQVARQLHVTVSPAEKESIEQLPTSDMAAFDLYIRARDLFPAATNNNSGKQDLLEAADLLNQAVARDPSYFEAYCQLAGIHDTLYLLAHDHIPRRLALAEAAISAARRLRPNAGETHLAQATHLYSAYLNYDAALAELELARKSLPNDCRVFELTGLIQARRCNPEEAVREFQHATELDPRNVFRLERLCGSYWFMRRYRQAREIYDRALTIEPDNVQVRVFRADANLAWKADTSEVHQAIDAIRAANPGAIREVADSWVVCALADRDPAATKAALIAAGENTPLNDSAVHFNRSFVEGWIARLEKDEPRAQIAFESARAEQKKVVQAQPDYAPPLCVLGVIDAALGRKQEALSECRRAVELLPVEKDGFNGQTILQWYAISAGWVGEKDLALEQLAKAVNAPGWVSYGYLKLLPFWDPLRGDPRFEAIVASLAPRAN